MPRKARNVILAVDDTLGSDFACDWAIKHFLRSEDCCHVVHCVPPPVPELTFTLPSARVVRVQHSELQAQSAVAAEWYRRMEARYGAKLAHAQLQHQLHVVCEPPGSEKGAVGRALCEQAEGIDAAAVVLASHGHGGITQLLLGSVADYLVHHCNKPVAILHRLPKGSPASAPVPGAASRGEPAPLPATAVESASISGGNGGVFLNSADVHAPSEVQCVAEWLGPTASTAAPQFKRHVVVATDASADSTAVCNWAVENIYRPGDLFHIVHVVPLVASLVADSMPTPAGCLSEADAAGSEALALEENMWRAQAPVFSELLTSAGVPHRLEMVLEYAPEPGMAVSHALARAANRLHAAALVLASHKRRSRLMELLQGSVTTGVVTSCKQPVVVLHGHAVT